MSGPGTVALPFSKPYPSEPSGIFSAYIFSRRTSPPAGAVLGGVSAELASAAPSDNDVTPVAATAAPPASTRRLKVLRSMSNSPLRKGI
ncbi:hypothetical protein Sfulv_53000 [Streptomyces fulvorobeus]|uniref:Uncharacterized protein n=1 Tax=Streptomyces fulvorobeus TaxID=284028 RepID=A0A7J0CDA8_9ACTN|nr:hypothetical protein Sfulv_53000 [Streptomyces fulvorobeus]